MLRAPRSTVQNMETARKGVAPGAAGGLDGGEHWLVELRGVTADRLAGAAGRAALVALFERAVAAFALRPLSPPFLHTFDGHDGAAGAGGSTALLALTESHLAAHGFPEAGVLCIDLFTCRPRGLEAADAAPWRQLAEEVLGPCEIEVRRIERGGVRQECPR